MLQYLNTDLLLVQATANLALQLVQPPAVHEGYPWLCTAHQALPASRTPPAAVSPGEEHAAGMIWHYQTGTAKDTFKTTCD